MALAPALVSRGRTDWETPEAVFAAYQRVYALDLDVCATAETAKCERWYGQEQDGLRQSWDGRVWCNPPYGREITDWVKRARWSVQRAGTADLAVMLLPSRTDTRWFHEHLYRQPGVSLDFIPGRLRFEGAPSPAPFPSLIALIVPPVRAMVSGDWGSGRVP
jgi:phage N-6-adenine-methyltransferase